MLVYIFGDSCGSRRQDKYASIFEGKTLPPVPPASSCASLLLDQCSKLWTTRISLACSFVLLVTPVKPYLARAYKHAILGEPPTSMKSKFQFPETAYMTNPLPSLLPDKTMAKLVVEEWKRVKMCALFTFGAHA